ncbi:MAG: hypothetical protein R3E92_19515 [Burkholderiaceae bacterium]|nr:hypothetical protein [Rhodoferax sp.]MCB2004401.1 hypothetical protein [Rhodoferax sp.]MCB2027390.1 hypothetical protein [Rhodoferax sp.]MCW5627938.1 hypothetical protein [Rhodoferax sp.]MCW5644466.1 hypothetical protein [Rhodoferax sp.]
MPTTRPYWPQALRTIAPWISATIAVLAAAVLLSQFIDTLHLSIERGQALRKAQAAPAAVEAPAAAVRLAGASTQR